LDILNAKQGINENKLYDLIVAEAGFTAEKDKSTATTLAGIAADELAGLTGDKRKAKLIELTSVEFWETKVKDKDTASTYANIMAKILGIAKTKEEITMDTAATAAKLAHVAATVLLVAAIVALIAILVVVFIKMA